jgi:hypothetical protein
VHEDMFDMVRMIDEMDDVRPKPEPHDVAISTRASTPSFSTSCLNSSMLPTSG